MLRQGQSPEFMEGLKPGPEPYFQSLRHARARIFRAQPITKEDFTTYYDSVPKPLKNGPTLL